MAEPHNRSENMETRKIKEAGSRSPRKSDYARQLRLQIVHFYTITRLRRGEKEYFFRECANTLT